MCQEPARSRVVVQPIVTTLPGHLIINAKTIVMPLLMGLLVHCVPFMRPSIITQQVQHLATAIRVGHVPRLVMMEL